MAKSFPLEIFTPERLFYWGDAEIVICRTLSGEEGFMADHIWGCKLLDIGELRFREKDQKEFRIAAISGGYIDVKERILIFTDTAEWPEAIDVKRAKEKQSHAEAWLAEHSAEDANPGEMALCLQTIRRSKNRIAVASGGTTPKR